METAIEIVTDTDKKKDHWNMIKLLCMVLLITIRKNYEEIFQKIDQNAVFIAVIDKNYVGYAALCANNHESRIAYISMIGVVQDMQRMHIK